MSTSFNKHILALALGLGFFSWQSCKERTVIPGDLIPGVDNIHTFELGPGDLDISLQTGLFDSLKTNDSLNSTIGLGNIPNDPFFGSIRSGLFLQVVPPATNYKFPAGLVLDSARICIPYANLSYGDTTNPGTNYQYFKVYRVTEPMVKESVYYTFQQFLFDPAPIGAGAISLSSLTDTFYIPGDTLSGQIRIRLHNQFAQSIIDADSASLATADAFKSFLNGLYISPVDTIAAQNRISYFRLAGTTQTTTTRIDFYFHDQAGASQLVSFPFSPSRSAFVNRIIKNYTGKPANDFIQNTQGRDSVIVQGYPGLYTEITLRNLDAIPPSVVNKAQIILTTVPVGADDTYAPPLRLFLEKLDDEGVAGPIADVLGGSGTPTGGGLDFMDGKPKEILLNGVRHYQYKLNFPRELQNRLKQGEQEITLRISSGTTYPGAFRLVAEGLHGGNPEARLQASIIYTKIQ